MLRDTLSGVKGYISYPCCKKEKAVVYEGAHGRASYKCPHCGKFAVFDFDKMSSHSSRAMLRLVDNIRQRDKEVSIEPIGVN